MLRRLSLLLCGLFVLLSAVAQSITGVVTDAKTREPLPFVNVVIGKAKHTMTDANGRYRLPFSAGELRVSSVGYETQRVKVTKPGQMNFQLKSTGDQLKEAKVTGRKQKYSRKNNPAVELMKKVIAAKKLHDLKERDYYTINKYSKITLAFNDVTDKVFEEGKFKNFPFLKDHVEVCNETGKLILPLTVDETVTQHLYRRDPRTEKSIIIGERHEGIDDLFATGDIIDNMLKDCFTEVNIYEDNVRLLQYPFKSPISEHGAINFYRYFIIDTLAVGGDSCIRVDFTPNNPQDFGFSGAIYIHKDSTYRVKRADIGIPARSDVNWVERMKIIQEFTQLPTGEQVLVKDDMLIELKIVDFVQKMRVKRTTEYTNFSFDEIPARRFKKIKGTQAIDPDAKMRDADFWQAHRSEELTRSEDDMGGLIRKLEGIKGFKPVLFVAKAFIENFVETTADPKKPSKVDIGPVNTMISQNFVDGLRLRASAQTTANLHPNIFLRGYVAYGFKDHRWKGLGEVTYSFNKKGYLPREFPVNNLTFSYNRDVMSPSDKFLPTDKDNVFVSFKWTTVDHMMYYENYKLAWDCEWENGLRVKAHLAHNIDEPTAALFYQPLSAGATPTSDANSNIKRIKHTELHAGFTYQPGVSWINTKQRRIATNNDAPILSLSHTVGLKGVLGSDYTYNFTEAGIYKRFWLGSWGRIDTQIKGGAQWNKVPFPLLIMPAANLSYIIEDHTFNLIDNMEFLNDRYASLMTSWDMNGKIFNRIPLLKKLKWREFIGCNVLWGTLTDKNNPFLAANANSAELMHFPGHFNADGSFNYLSTVMDKNKPYVEVVAGIHNIFKLFHVQYVRRLTYTNHSKASKQGVRIMFRMTF